MSDLIRVLQSKNFAETIAGEARLVVVDVWAPWCGPCRAMTPHIEQAAQELAGQALFCKLNADDNPELVRQFKVMGIPTLLFFKNGKLVDRKTGMQTAAAITKRAAPLLTVEDERAANQKSAGWFRWPFSRG